MISATGKPTRCAISSVDGASYERTFPAIGLTGGWVSRPAAEDDDGARGVLCAFEADRAEE